ncbi:Scaffolding protein, partial CDS, partial [Neorhizobium galegae bv. officinalis]
ENATTDIERTETTEAHNASTSEDEIEDDAEQPDEDSEGVEGDETEDAADDEQADTSNAIPDDTLVDVNGEKFTVKELKEGYRRQSDYTKKMQEIASLRKQWMVQEVDKHQIRSAFENQINGLMTVVSQEFDLTEPNWEAEWENDPYEAQKKKFQWEKQQEKRIKRLQEIAGYKAQIDEQKKQFEVEQTRQRKIEAREVLANEMPEVFGDKHANTNLGAVETFLNEQGVPADMIAGIDNPVLIKLAYFAMQHLNIAKQVPKAVKAVEAKPVMAAPTTSASSKKPAGDHVTNSIRRYQKTGSEDDATAIFKDLLNN